MNQQKLIYLAVGVVAGFVIGFAFANGVNRAGQDKTRAELARLRGGSAGDGAAAKSGAPSGGGDSARENLTEEELRRAVAK
ncbi:MAG: hypothetical protein ACRD68_11285, partial [Pyrinomonadaceae bacterium]